MRIMNYESGIRKKRKIYNSLFPIPNSNFGFTLLELLLSVAVISTLAGLSLPVYRTLLMKNDLDIAAVTTAQSLRRSQILSQAVDGDTT